MKQLTLEDIYKMCVYLESKGYNLEELPVYLGNDDELNGIHCAWFNQFIDSKEDSEEVQDIIDLINSDSANIKLEDKGILFS